MTLEDAVIFIGSLFACAVAVAIFLRALLHGLPGNILTVPTMVFVWVYFVVVPAANVAFDTYVDERVFITEPVGALTLLNLVNAVLLAVATLGVRIARARRARPASDQAGPPPIGLMAALGALVVVSVLYGFYTIYLSAAVLSTASGQLQFSGSLYQYVVIESGPLAFCWLATLYFVRQGRRPATFEAVLVGLVQLLLIMLLSSSRGSRVAIISQMLICAQIFSFCIYRFRARHYIVGGVGLALFLQVYAYYKYGGIDALSDYVSGRSSSETVERYNNPVTFLVGDIGRADIQAPLISRYLEGTFTPNRIGETYLSGASLLLPRQLRPASLRPKTQIGADAQLDRGAAAEDYRGVVLDEGAFVSSRIYGLLGEALLNFGWLGPPLAFLLFGFLSRAALLRAVDFRDWRGLLTTPFFAAVPIYLLFYDFDNLIVQSVTVWALPVAILVFFGRTARRT